MIQYSSSAIQKNDTDIYFLEYNSMILLVNRAQYVIPVPNDMRFHLCNRACGNVATETNLAFM